MFTGKKIRLREQRKEDIPILNKIVNEEEVLRNHEAGIPLPHAVEVEEEAFSEMNKKQDADNPCFIIEKLDGTVVGICGTSHTDWKNSLTRVGICIGGGEHRGKGYGTEALHLLVAFIFREMNLNRVQLAVFSFNDRAIKSYEKIGFKLEGTLREEIYRNGKYHDVYLMSILKNDFVKKWGDSHVV